MSAAFTAFLRKALRALAVPDRLAAAAFFILLLACGLLVYRDYGVSWDEPNQLRIGVANYRYVTQQDPALLSLRDRYYGPLFEMLLVRFQSKGGDQAVYFSRHLLNFLCFYAGCLAFYLLARRTLRNGLPPRQQAGGTSPHRQEGGWAALGGAAFLALSPRIFADAFYNSKDIPFMAFTIFGLLTLHLVIERPSLPRLGVHALASAALIDVRLPGLFLPALTLAGLGLEVIGHRLTLRRALALIPPYLAVTAGAALLGWPALWQDPLGGFAQAWEMMSHFPQESGMLYLGQTITTLAIPWHYIPVWLAVTTPLLYLTLFILGLAAMLAAFPIELRRGRASTPPGRGQVPTPPGRGQAPTPPGRGITPRARDDLLILGALFIPLLVVIGMKSVLYDAWRQMFFIYPPFLLVAARGLLWGWNALAARLERRLAVFLVSATLALGFLPILVWMAANHPYQNVYFNRLAGPDMAAIQQRFELDYWGLAYRKGLEYLVRTHKEGDIRVYMETAAGQASVAILPAQDAARVKIVRDFAVADSFIANYYLHPQPYPLEHEVFTVYAGNAKILSVFSLDATLESQEKTK